MVWTQGCSSTAFRAPNWVTHIQGDTTAGQELIHTSEQPAGQRKGRDPLSSQSGTAHLCVPAGFGGV